MAVKVQRPEIRQRIVEDLEAFDEIAGMLDRHTEWGRTFGFRNLVGEFRRTLFEELDYRREASNLEVLGRNLSEFDRIVVPQPVEDYTTERVLTMEFVHGIKVTGLSPLRRLEVDGEALADVLFEAYLKQILVDGFCHADPHPGNVFLTRDDRLALIDLGMTARISSGAREKLLKLMIAIGEGRAEEAAAAAEELGEPVDGLYDPKGLRRRVVELVGRYQDATVRDIQVGRVVMEISRAAAASGIRAPTELTMLGKTLLNLDAVGRTLAPDFDPNAAIRRHAGELTTERMWQDVSPASVMSSMLETAEFVKELPGRVNRILDRVASNELEIKVNSMDERTVRLPEGRQSHHRGPGAGRADRRRGDADAGGDRLHGVRLSRAGDALLPGRGRDGVRARHGHPAPRLEEPGPAKVTAARRRTRSGLAFRPLSWYELQWDARERHRVQASPLAPVSHEAHRFRLSKPNPRRE